MRGCYRYLHLITAATKVALPVFCVATICVLTFKHRDQSTGILRHAANKDQISSEASNKVNSKVPGKTDTFPSIIPTGYKAIFYATKFFNRDYPPKYHTFTLCKVDSCVITQHLHMADAVVYHGTDLSITDNEVNQLKHARQLSNKVWVFFEKERPRMPYGSLHHLSLYNGLFNWTATYKRSSDLHTGHGIAIKFKTTQMSPEQIQDYAAYDKKKKLGVIVTSNCLETETDKWQVLRALKKHGLQIDILGKCTNNYYAHPLSNLKTSGYKFYFAFHNSRCQDYTTEKIWLTAYENSLVPVILGGKSGKNLAEELPPHSYIHIHDFKSTRQLADYLIKVNNSKTLYDTFFSWKSSWRVYPNYLKDTTDIVAAYNGQYVDTQGNGRMYPGRELDLVCTLCKALHNKSKMVTTKLENHLEQFWNYQNDCNKTQLKID